MSNLKWAPLSLLVIPNFATDILKKKVLAYLIERYFGQYFLKKLNLDQLDLNFGKNTGSKDSTCTLKNISLDTTHLNELAEKQNWPIQFLDGYVQTLQATVPLTTLLTNPTFFEVTGLSLTIQPKQRSQDVPTSMFDSMWSSISSSTEVVEDCVKQLDAPEGIDYLYQKIEAVISRVKVKFVDTVIHVEHVPENSSNGVGITIHVDKIEYSDEAGKDPTRDESTKLSDQDPKKTNFVQSLTSKLFTVEGITFSTIEFLSENRTFPKSNLCQSSYESEDEDSDADGTFKEASDSFESNRDQFQEDQKTFDAEQLNEHKHAKEGHHSVVFASLSGAQQIKLSLKQSEDSVGPKVSIVANFGILALFLTPRQVHLLLELANGFSSTDMENRSKRTPVSKCTTKPLSKCDEQTVEEALLQRLQAPDIRGLQGLQAAAYGWSASDQGENDTDDIFLPMNNAVSGMYESAISGNSSSMASSVSSSMASSATELSHQTRRRLSNLDSDPTAEISHFEVKIATLAIVLLHEDLMQQSAEIDQILLLPSVQVMQQTSNGFFKNMKSFVVSESEEENFKNASAAISKVCSFSHLRLLAATVEIEENEKVTSSAFSVVGQLTTAKLELNEFCLIGSLENLEAIPLLQFVENAPNDSEKSCLKVSFKHVEKTSRNMIRKNSGPRTDISLSISKCNVEIDVTIIDRLSALLAFPKICRMEKSSWNSRIAGTVPITLPTITNAESKMDLKLTCPKLNVKLRFPVPDFRPANCMDRSHWWERNVRPDFLSIVFSDILMQTTFQTEQTFQEYSIQSKVIDIYYSENEKHNPHHLAKAYCSENSSFSKDDKLFQNSLSIKVFPTKNNDLEECQEPELDPMTQSCYGAFAKQTNVDPGPFCSRKVVHHSDNPHTKPQEENSSELLLPGEKHEIDEFVQSTTSSSKIQVEISLPLVSAQLSSKHIFEVLYNRINNELLMWTPSAPKPKMKPYSYETQWATRKDGRNIYSMCESAPLFSDSDIDSDEDSDTGNIFYSTHDRQTNRSQNQDISINDQSNFTLNLQIGRGMVYMNPPVRDSSSNVVPGQQGNFLFNLKNATVFLVSGYRGDEDLSYVCVQSHTAELFHCDMQAIPSKIPSLKEIGSMVGKHLQSTIYKSDAGMLAAAKDRGGNREMLTVAIKIRDNYTVTRNEIVVVDAKSIHVSVGLNKCTLRHRTVEEPNGWISHLLDFFNLTDYPIPNYVAKDVLTEINLHLWDCAIDYRPLHLPIRSAITMGTFGICMNMSLQPNSSTATFTLGECVLFLSERGPPKKGVASSVAVNLTKDYFSVAHLGLLEISLKTNEKVTAGNPRIDLRILNNYLRFTTCADSGKMLIDLLVYLSNKGDLTHTLDSESSPFSSPKHYVEQELVKLDPQKTSELTRSRQDYMVGELLDAMHEPVIFEETRKLSTEVAARLPPTEVTPGIPSKQIAPRMSSIDVAPVIPSTEVAPRMPPAEVALGMPHTEIALGMPSIIEAVLEMSPTEGGEGKPHTEVGSLIPPTEVAPMRSSTEVVSRISSTEVASRISSTEVASRISSTEVASRISSTEVASRISSTEVASRISSTEVASRISSTGVPTTRIYFAGERRRPPRDGRSYQRNVPANSDPLVTRELGDVCTYRHYWSSDTDEEYVVVANEPGLFPRNGEPEIKWLTADPVRLVNDHFAAPEGKVDILEAPKTFPDAVIRYSLRDMSVVWYTFGGHDFELPGEKKGKTKGVHFSDKQSSARVFYGGVDLTLVSSNLGDQNKNIPWLYRGGVNRRQDIRMEFYLNKVRFSYEVYPESTLQASRLVLTISDFSITDKLQESKINKFLYHYTSEDKPKRSRAHMMVVKALYIRPDTMRNVQECCLKVSMLPLRFNIDQDSLLFLITFFGELGGGSSNGNEMNFNKPSTPPTQQPPILMLGRENEEMLIKQAALKTVDENLIMLTSRYQPEPVSSCACSDTSSVHSFPDDSPVYIRFFEFSPDVLIRLDYHGKRVDFTHGSLHGLLMGLAQLNCSELVLKILHNRQGILGFDKLMAYIVQEFHNDIKNQLPRLLGGVGPMHAVLQLLQGIKDFLWMPIEQFQKDGRIVRGIQRGTNSFTTSTTKAALELTCQLINLIQATAETAYDVLSPGPSLKRIAMAKKKKKRYSQPQDIREGVANALSIVRDGIGDTASNLVQVATYEKEQKGYSGAVGGVLREIPSTIVKPILVVAGATSDILGGVRNQLVPDARREANEKWRTDFE